MSLHLYLAFVAACIALALLPGPIVTMVIANGLRHGTRAAMINIAGAQLGLAITIGIVAVGLTTLMATMGYWFDWVRFAGAAYLVWLGISQWRASATPLVAAGDARVRTRRELVVRGWAINAVNPKGTVFMLAVVPQFLDLALPLLPQYAVIAASLGFTDLVVMAGYTAFAAKVLRTLDKEHHARWMNRSFGGLFVLAGSLLATWRRVP